MLDADKGIATEARYLSTPGARSGNSPWKLGPCIVITLPDLRDLATYICGPGEAGQGQFEIEPIVY
jgi:hypothetical protein